MVDRAACGPHHHGSGAMSAALLVQDELAAVASLLGDAGIETRTALSATLIAGGRSNLTFKLTDGESQWVLRTPPRTGRTPSAHDVAREYRVTAALDGNGVPVARPLLLCEDESVLGGPFMVAEFVEGRTVQSSDDLDALGDDEVSTLVTGLITALVRLHAVDHVAVGLDRLGRPDGYAERQLRRWSAQWDIVAADRLRPLASELSRRLGSRVPAQGSTSVVHGDYRIDNAIIGRHDVGVRAVVDWELSTLGDPVADVAMMCAYRNPAFDLIVGEPSAWASPRLPGVDHLAAAYQQAGGARLTEWDFHLGLACFKVAVIAAGIDHRRQAGSGAGAGFDSAGQAVEPFLEAGLTALGVTA